MPSPTPTEEYKLAAREADIPILSVQEQFHLLVYVASLKPQDKKLSERLVRFIWETTPQGDLKVCAPPDWEKSRSALLEIPKDFKNNPDAQRVIAKLIEVLEPLKSDWPVDKALVSKELFPKLFFLERMSAKLVDKTDWQTRFTEYLCLLKPQEMELSERLVRWMKTGTPDWEKNKSTLLALSKNSDTTAVIAKLIDVLEPPETNSPVEEDFIKKINFLEHMSSEVLPLNKGWRRRCESYLSSLGPQDLECSKRLVRWMVAGTPHGEPNPSARMDWEESKSVLLEIAKSPQTSAGDQKVIAELIQAVEPPKADRPFDMSTVPKHLVNPRNQIQTPSNSNLVSQLQTTSSSGQTTHLGPSIKTR